MDNDFMMPVKSSVYFAMTRELSDFRCYAASMEVQIKYMLDDITRLCDTDEQRVKRVKDFIEDEHEIRQQYISAYYKHTTDEQGLQSDSQG